METGRLSEQVMFGEIEDMADAATFQQVTGGLDLLCHGGHNEGPHQAGRVDYSHGDRGGGGLTSVEGGKSSTRRSEAENMPKQR